MLDLANVLQLVEDGFDEGDAAQHGLLEVHGLTRGKQGGQEQEIRLSFPSSGQPDLPWILMFSNPLNRSAKP